MEPIFHIAEKSTWEAAIPGGAYAQSTRGQSLEDVGFIHCSYRHQVLDVANALYQDTTSSLVLLTIAPRLLDAPLVPESPTEGAAPFPHLYGALNVGAVIDVSPFERGEADLFVFPGG